MTSTTSNKLSFEVIPGNYALPGNQPATYTLVRGRRDALLVDVPFARSEARRLIAGFHPQLAITVALNRSWARSFSRPGQADKSSQRRQSMS